MDHTPVPPEQSPLIELECPLCFSSVFDVVLILPNHIIVECFTCGQNFQICIRDSGEQS